MLRAGWIVYVPFTSRSKFASAALVFSNLLLMHHVAFSLLFKGTIFPPFFGSFNLDKRTVFDHIANFPSAQFTNHRGNALPILTRFRVWSQSTNNLRARILA